MAGLSLNVGGFGGVKSTDEASYGSSTSYDNVTAAAFGPGVSTPVASGASALHPMAPTGLAVWAGIAAVAALVLIRYSLPN